MPTNEHNLYKVTLTPEELSALHGLCSVELMRNGLGALPYHTLEVLVMKLATTAPELGLRKEVRV